MHKQIGNDAPLPEGFSDYISVPRWTEILGRSQPSISRYMATIPHHPRAMRDPIFGKLCLRLSELKAFSREYHKYRTAAQTLFTDEKIAAMSPEEKADWGMIEGQHFGRVA